MQIIVITMRWCIPRAQSTIPGHKTVFYLPSWILASFCVSYVHQPLNRLCSKTAVNNTIEWSKMEWNYDKHNLFGQICYPTRKRSVYYCITVFTGTRVFMHSFVPYSNYFHQYCVDNRDFKIYNAKPRRRRLSNKRIRHTKQREK